MKIVGLISNEEEIYEMEDIAKIFLIGQRMKNLSYDRQKLSKIKNRNEKSSEKNIHKGDAYSRLPIFTVRGFN
jgi:hypothetical protein